LLAGCLIANQSMITDYKIAMRASSSRKDGYSGTIVFTFRREHVMDVDALSMYDHHICIMSLADL
jgi:hypothetical protein